MNICVIPEGDPASPLNFVARLRLIEPLEVLSRRKKFTWTCQPATRRLSLANQQIAILQRACFPTRRLLEDALRSLSRAKRNGTRVVYEIDDHLFCPDLRALIERSAVDEVDERSYKRHQAHRAIFELVDAVICSTADLATAIRQLNVSVPIYVLPTAPDFRQPRWRCDRSPLVRAAGEYRVGWCGGSRVGRDLELVLAAVQRILAQHPGVTFVLGGSPKYSRLFASLPHGRLRTLEWVPYDSYPASLRQYDLALLPWENNAYNCCKTALKAIDYNAMGIPVVCSAGSPCAVHVQRAISESGRVAATMHDWETNIEWFLRNRTPAHSAKRLSCWTRKQCDYRAHAELHWQLLQQIADTGPASRN